ncbi:hypothetical protein BV511_00990 [Methylorubrum extorquens]|nr:hypothetical protein BV511_00990 [Methylorubrum extorquens]
MTCERPAERQGYKPACRLPERARRRILWRRFDMMSLTSEQHLSVSSLAAAAIGFDNRWRDTNLRRVMPFVATLNRGLLRAGNLIAGK